MAASEATSTGYISREFPAVLVVTKLDVVNEKSGHVCGDKTRCSQCDLRNNRGGFVATLTFFPSFPAVFGCFVCFASNGPNQSMSTAL